MHNSSTTLSMANVNQIIEEYRTSVEILGNSIAGLKGLRLLKALKRDTVGAGPYPDVTLFEAANRIMSDLVILSGVKWLLDNRVFPFDIYIVEYGNEQKNKFDIRGTANGITLIGEVFNVAPTFFQSKKGAMLKKLRDPRAVADFKIVMFNHDAVQSDYVPETQDKEFFVIVNIGTGRAKVVPNPSLQRTAAAPLG